MKTMKKVLAMLLTLAMVMGMTMTTMAATKNSATIKVDNYVAGEGSELKYVQVIVPNTTTETGWDIDDKYASAFTSALGASSEQEAIAMLVKAALADGATLPAGTPSIIMNAKEATAVQIDKALSNVLKEGGFDVMTNPQTVTSAGVYAITAKETGFTYKTMAAYVGFGVVEGYDYPSLEDASVTAKKAPTTVTKADDDVDNAVYIGQKVTYTIETTFPYFDPNATGKYFDVYDAIEGAAYVNLTGENKTAKVTIGGVEKTADFVQDGDTFEVNLTSYIDDSNTYANQKVVVTYDAIVDEITVENKAGTHVFDVAYDSNVIKLYTGEITLVKHEAGNEDIKLANAGFEVTKKGEKTPLKFIKNAATGHYTYAPNATGEEVKTEVFTDSTGNVVVEGLDIGTYVFTEKTAPTGYSINENPTEIVLDITDEGEAKDGEAIKVYADNGKMADTKLAALPSTGGIGTTIFTIGGCAIMIAAAFLFFASRKREEA